MLDAVGEVIDGLESEPLNKSYKLVLLRALLHDGTLRTGAPVRQVAERSRNIILGDPRLLKDVTSTEIPDLQSSPPESWEAYWRRGPVAAWAGELLGEPGRWFRLVGDRFEPNFTVPNELDCRVPTISLPNWSRSGKRRRLDPEGVAR